MAYTTRQERCPLGEIETWIFDLDNTLYPASCDLFPQVQQRMNEEYLRPPGGFGGAGGRAAAHLFPRARHDDERADEGQQHRPARLPRFVHEVDPLACRPTAGRRPPATQWPQDRPHQRLGAAPSGCSITRLSPAFSGIIDIVAADFRAEAEL
jgi:putative hydrolase of the HAD superfamily